MFNKDKNLGNIVINTLNSTENPYGLIDSCISCYDLLELKKIKEEQKRKFVCNLFPQFVDVQSAFLYGNNIKLFFEQKENPMRFLVNYKNGELIIPNETKYFIEENEYNKKFILDIIEYLYQNNFDKNFSTNTIDSKFKLIFDQRYCKIFLNNDFTNKKIFSITIKDYEQGYGFQTNIGSIDIYTNISKLKRLFNCRKANDNVLKLIQNLKIFESDLPKYVKENVKILKK